MSDRVADAVVAEPPLLNRTTTTSLVELPVVDTRGPLHNCTLLRVHLYVAATPRGSWLTAIMAGLARME